MILRVRKKPVEVRAAKNDGTTPGVDYLVGWVRTTSEQEAWRDGLKVSLYTVDGNLAWVGPGDYLMKGAKGEFYPCRADIFEATHEVIGNLGGAE